MVVSEIQCTLWQFQQKSWLLLWSPYGIGQTITPCLKKTSHLWLAITLTHMNGFWYFFGIIVTNKVSNQKTLYYATWNNLCFCTTWQNGETRKLHFSLNLIMLHTQCTCVLSSWKKKLSSVMYLIASNICWDVRYPINTVRWLLLQAWRRTTPTFYIVTDSVTDLANTEHVGNRQHHAMHPF